MSDKRGKNQTGDTGSPEARPRDDLRTGSKKGKPDDQRSDSRDENLKEPQINEKGKSGPPQNNV